MGCDRFLGPENEIVANFINLSNAVIPYPYYQLIIHLLKNMGVQSHEARPFLRHENSKKCERIKLNVIFLLFYTSSSSGRVVNTDTDKYEPSHLLDFTRNISLQMERARLRQASRKIKPNVAMAKKKTN